MTADRQDSEAAMGSQTSGQFSEEQRAHEGRVAANEKAAEQERTSGVQAEVDHVAKVAAEAAAKTVVEEVRTEAHDEADRALEKIHAEEAKRAEALKAKAEEAVAAEADAAKEAAAKEAGRKTNDGLHDRLTELEAGFEQLKARLRGITH